MFINSWMGVVQERFAVHKRRPHFQSVCAPWEHAAQQSGARCVRCLLCVRSDYVITDWPISDHMIVKSVNYHRDHMAQGYSQQPCTM
ncbi:unnamed protein product [Staurois parvus]|uniref:Uncharacterized protein n=1 Tax=Staurois parvus TaxID=386267 RepID=A0ABN9A645_9NEOB|nr:unnamed protein product [Staurois parvus]